ncbi:MAG TPA: hypothetical protein VF116_14475 [Ktedonobacterales bacterium]
MTYDETVERFCRAVNDRLARGPQEQGAEIAGVVRAEVAQHAGEPALLDRLEEAARQAIQPRAFYDVRAMRPDLIFEQCDTLLRENFEPDVLDPKERMVLMLERLADPTHTFPIVLMGRFWRASGPQEYDAAGHLTRFGFDPLAVTESIAASISAHYMSLQPVGRPGEAIGAIGNIVTRARFRGGQGHGTALTEAFERETVRIAQERGETVRLYILESEEDSQGFWHKRGYRWPLGTRYAQPPLEFDPQTGERLYDEVPETLMVKMAGQPDAIEVDAELLTAAVRIMYLDWCLAETKTYPLAARKRAEEYVLGKVLGEFRASLPPDGQPVPLVKPPLLQ